MRLSKSIVVMGSGLTIDFYCKFAKFLYFKMKIQMMVKPKDRETTEKRALLWELEELSTLKHRLIQRAGRLTQPSAT